LRRKGVGAEQKKGGKQMNGFRARSVVIIRPKPLSRDLTGARVGGGEVGKKEKGGVLL